MHLESKMSEGFEPSHMLASDNSAFCIHCLTSLVAALALQALTVRVLASMRMAQDYQTWRLGDKSIGPSGLAEL